MRDTLGNKIRLNETDKWQPLECVLYTRVSSLYLLGCQHKFSCLFFSVILSLCSPSKQTLQSMCLQSAIQGKLSREDKRAQ